MKIATLALQMAAIAALAGCVTAKKPGYDTLIAHRGESKDAPENTLPAYKLAVERGFGFECDLYLSKDGRVFTFHDPDLKRTTGGANASKCADVTWKDTLAKNGKRIYLEIKSGPEIVPVVKAILSSQGNATPDNVLFISFSQGVCKAVKDVLPEYTVYWLVGSHAGKGESRRPVTVDEVIAGAREAAADGVDMQFDPDVVDEAFVAAVKKEGLSFHVWTVDDLPQMLRAFAVGADTVTTNCAKDLLDEYAMLFAPEPDGRDEFSDRSVDGAAYPMMP